VNEVARSLPSHVDDAPMEPLPVAPVRTMRGVFRDARQRTRVSVGAILMTSPAAVLLLSRLALRHRLRNRPPLLAPLPPP
jgi:hypothetical protein